MKTKHKIFLVFQLLSIFTSFSQEIDDTTFIKREIYWMNNIWKYQIGVDIDDVGTIESLPNQNIHIGLDQLNEICASSNDTVRKYLMRFVLAHEFAHQIQYYMYRSDAKKLNNDLVSKTLLETQADLMAGQIFFAQEPMFLNLMNTDPELLNEILIEIMRIGYELGSREIVQGSHPSRHDRALAVRSGLSMGLSYQLDQIVQSNPNYFLSIGLTPATYKKTMDAQFDILDYSRGESLPNWSYRQAKKIVNNDRKISSDIILITPENERHNFNSDPDSPFVNYDLTYKNIGNETVYIEMEVFVTLILRSNPNSGQYSRKLNTKNHKFFLAPGETKSITGELNWLKNDVDFISQFGIQSHEMPRIVYPSINSTDALISCTYVNDVSNEVYQDEIEFLNFNSDSEDLDFPIFYNSLMNTLLLDGADLIQGIGEMPYPNGVLAFNCSKQFKDGSKTKVYTELNKEIFSVELEFPNTYPNSQSTLNHYYTMKNYLDSKLTNAEVEEGSDPDGSLWTTYYLNGYEIYIEAAMYPDIYDYTCSMSIDFDE